MSSASALRYSSSDSTVIASPRQSLEQPSAASSVVRHSASAASSAASRDTGTRCPSSSSSERSAAPSRSARSGSPRSAAHRASAAASGTETEPADVLVADHANGRERRRPCLVQLAGVDEGMAQVVERRDLVAAIARLRVLARPPQTLEQRASSPPRDRLASAAPRRSRCCAARAAGSTRHPAARSRRGRPRAARGRDRPSHCRLRRRRGTWWRTRLREAWRPG